MSSAAYAGSSTTAYNGNTSLNFSGVPPFGNIGFNNTDNYTVVLKGYIYLPAGTSNFSTTSDDGSMLYIDGNTVVNNNYYQGATLRNGSVTETTAGYHQIEVAYYQGGGGQSLTVTSDLTGTNILVNGTGLDQVCQITSPNFSNAITVNGNSTLDMTNVAGGVTTFGALLIGAECRKQCDHAARHQRARHHNVCGHDGRQWADLRRAERQHREPGRNRR